MARQRRRATMAVLAWPLAAAAATPMRPPGEPGAAERAEFEAAARAGTVAGWDLFLARHPDSRLAAAARAARDRLRPPG